MCFCIVFFCLSPVLHGVHYEDNVAKSSSNVPDTRLDREQDPADASGMWFLGCRRFFTTGHQGKQEEALSSHLGSKWRFYDVEQLKGKNTFFHLKIILETLLSALVQEVDYTGTWLPAGLMNVSSNRKQIYNSWIWFKFFPENSSNIYKNIFTSSILHQLLQNNIKKKKLHSCWINKKKTGIKT